MIKGSFQFKELIGRCFARPVSSDPHRTESRPQDLFESPHYMRHNQRRLEHLASLGLDLNRKSVLELGAGIGDHTNFFLDRECSVLITEARTDNLAVIKSRYPDCETKYLNLEEPPSDFHRSFEIVYCYGILYHLANPELALKFAAPLCKDLFLLETCVSFRETGSINNVQEDINDSTQSISGIGCRPTRQWIFDQLKTLFQFVYMPITQPWHEEFPIDWTTEPPRSLNNLQRAIFIGSRKKIENPNLVEQIPMKQYRH